MTGRLADRVAVITGGASGIGEASTRRFVAEGARVVIADVQDDLGTSLADELGDRVRYVHTDVTSEANVAAAVDLAVGEFGGLDVMFNNAGIIGAIGPIADTTLAEFEFTLGVNLVGVFLGIKHAARVMKPRRQGVIINTASPAGLAGGHGPHAYGAAKAAVIGLARSVAAELRPDGIRVNVISPGPIVTPMTASSRTGDPRALEETKRQMDRSSLIGRAGLPDDIASAAVYLASDEASFVTATVLTVDGGFIGAPGSSPYAGAEHRDAALLREGGRTGIEASG